MTDKMKAVVEAVGYKIIGWTDYSVEVEIAHTITQFRNADLNDLFILAEKLYPKNHVFTIGRERDYSYIVLEVGGSYVWMGDTSCDEFNTISDCVLSALEASLEFYESIKGR
jgi:hypothetical protein